ncbi:hypothetical protein AB0M38_35270 [Streptomyces sp. NPDC051742]|uniref:hypothetical protein n=1 Tax=unclassified Streptomyces TaxID=2593676 RepID=UPI00342E65F8
MGGETLLASKWDAGVDVVRFLWVGFFSSLPAWARYTVLALFGLTVAYGFLTWLRSRSSSAPETEEAEGAEWAEDPDGTAQRDETRVR